MYLRRTLTLLAKSFLLKPCSMGEYFIKTFKILIDQVKLNDFSSKIMNTIFG